MFKGIPRVVKIYYITRSVQPYYKITLGNKVILSPIVILLLRPT